MMNFYLRSPDGTYARVDAAGAVSWVELRKDATSWTSHEAALTFFVNHQMADKIGLAKVVRSWA